MDRGVLYRMDTNQCLSVSTIKYRYAKSIHHSVSRHSEMENQFIVNCCVRGYHVYNTTWTPSVGEQLETFCEAGNEHDKHAVALTKENSSEVIGHLPRNISRTCWYFIKSKGKVTGEVSGRRRRTTAACGGMEVPCFLKFYHANPELVKKAKELITKKYGLA